MIAENNLESHGTWEAYNKGYVDLDFVVPKDKPQWREMMLDRANSCYQRDKNHPAILIWSCGNESFGGKTIYEMSQLFRQLDKHRLVHYEGVFSDRSYNDTSDMESQMYTPAAGIENSWQSILRNRLSAANIHMQWEIPAVLCTNIQSLQTASLDIRADLSGIILTSQSTKGQIRQVVPHIWRRFRRQAYRWRFQRKRHLLRRRERGFSKDAGG